MVILFKCVSNIHSFIISNQFQIYIKYILIHVQNLCYVLFAHASDTVQPDSRRADSGPPLPGPKGKGGRGGRTAVVVGAVAQGGGDEEVIKN